MPRGSIQCAPELDWEDQGELDGRGNYSCQILQNFWKDIRFPTNMEVLRVGSEMQSVSLHGCTQAPSPCCLQELGKGRTGCRAGPSKDHSSRLALDSSHTHRLHKHRLHKSEGENIQNPEAKFFPASCLIFNHLALERCSSLGLKQKLKVRSRWRSDGNTLLHGRKMVRANFQGSAGDTLERCWGRPPLKALEGLWGLRSSAGLSANHDPGPSSSSEAEMKLPSSTSMRGWREDQMRQINPSSGCHIGVTPLMTEHAALRNYITG